MKFGKMFKLARKGAKKVDRSRGGAATAIPWPEGTRVGVFGHENSGKTVYFTALYTQSKTTPNFHISVRDDATANEFFKNDMAIKGVGMDSGGAGTIAAKSVPKKFPDRTMKDIVLRFTAILDGKKKIPVVTYDYSGRAASISEHSDEAEKIRSFMADADGLLFFFDPKILGADPEVQARVSAFVNILSLLASLKSRLPIPVGLVITKADTLPGYSGEDKTILIRPENEQVIADDYEKFLERVLGFESLSEDREWASSVRTILVKLREFIRVVVGRTLDFQIFFVSSTGNKPEKIGAEVGRSIYAPPDKVNPCGVTVPFHWILNSIVRSRRLNVLRSVTGYVAAAAIVWMAIYSLPFVIHFNGLLRSPYRIEDKALGEVDGHHRSISEMHVADISKAYKRYKSRWLVRKMFPQFQVQAERMGDIYGGYGVGSEGERLNSIIRGLADVIKDPDARPKYDRVGRKMVENERTKGLVIDLREIRAGDERDATTGIAGRAYFIWGLYERHLKDPSNEAVRDSISDLYILERDRSDRSAPITELCKAMLTAVGGGTSSPVASTKGAIKSREEYEMWKEEINGEDPDPARVLKKAVEELQVIRAGLLPGIDDAQISAITSFINDARKWERKRPYKFRVQSVPDMGHIHIEVVESGGQPKWLATGDQIMQGAEIELVWKPGLEIHIAFDEVDAEEHWGRMSSDKIVLTDEYALFELEKQVRLPKGKTIQFSYKGGLKEQLPKLK